jgi:hypothetical protein
VYHRVLLIVQVQITQNSAQNKPISVPGVYAVRGRLFPLPSDK